MAKDESAQEVVTKEVSTPIIYFSSTTENTHRFVQKLGVANTRLPLRRTEPKIKATSPFTLVVPTYGFGRKDKVVPPQVIRFLNDPENRKHLIGVVGAGNMNFNKDYCLAAEVIHEKCGVPVLYRFEVLGTPEDVDSVKLILDERTQTQE